MHKKITCFEQVIFSVNAVCEKFIVGDEAHILAVSVFLVMIFVHISKISLP